MRLSIANRGSGQWREALSQVAGISLLGKSGQRDPGTEDIACVHRGVEARDSPGAAVRLGRSARWRLLAHVVSEDGVSVGTEE